MASLIRNVGAMASDAVASGAFGWPAQPPINKIDTHVHYVPDFYASALNAAGGDPSGWPIPQWSLESHELMMSRLGVAISVVSVTAPGVTFLRGTASHQLARQLNEYAATIVEKKPTKFGFFATVPDLLDTQAALAEIVYALDTLHADGITLFSRYGQNNTYLGSTVVEPIWAELNRRKAVVFVHPTHPVDLNKVNPRVPQPMIDYPHETTRTALDMITSGTRVKYPDCKVILSHAGGTLPFLLSRVIEPLARTPDVAAQAILGTTYTQAVADFRSFYYDLTLSTAPHMLDLVLKLVPHDRIIFGSDYPYPPAPAYPQFLEDLETYNMSIELRNQVNYKNIQAVLPRLV